MILGYLCSGSEILERICNVWELNEHSANVSRSFVLWKEMRRFSGRIAKGREASITYCDGVSPEEQRNWHGEKEHSLVKWQQEKETRLKISTMYTRCCQGGLFALTQIESTSSEWFSALKEIEGLGVQICNKLELTKSQITWNPSYWTVVVCLLQIEKQVLSRFKRADKKEALSYEASARTYQLLRGLATLP